MSFRIIEELVGEMMLPLKSRDTDLRGFIMINRKKLGISY